MYWINNFVLAVRHVEEGQARIEKLRAFISRLKLDGRPTDGAEQLLDTFECILEQMTWHKEFIEAQLLSSKDYKTPDIH